jgi:hypothetical protein
MLALSPRKELTVKLNTHGNAYFSLLSPHLNMPGPDQPALGHNGQLLDASQIPWYNDPEDAHPIQTAPDMQRGIILSFN